MKKQKDSTLITIIMVTIFLLIGSMAFAQEKVEVNGHDVGTWFKDHWMWVAGGALLLLILLLSSGGGGNRSKKTTVIKDNYGKVKSISTTEIVD